jgi:hypothetical protein
MSAAIDAVERVLIQEGVEEEVPLFVAIFASKKGRVSNQSGTLSATKPLCSRLGESLQFYGLSEKAGRVSNVSAVPRHRLSGAGPAAGAAARVDASHDRPYIRGRKARS